MRIYLNPPSLIPDEIHYVSSVLEKGWIAPNGPENKKLADLLASYHHTKETQWCTCSSGTAALHLIFKSLQLKKNEVVFCPALSFVATVNPVIQEGGMPWFVDIDSKTGGISPNLLKQAIQEAKSRGLKLKAVVLVHLMGFPAQIREIKQICDENNLFLIEDAAGALGSKVDSIPIATKYADATAFSFNGNKIITTSGGGAVFGSDEFIQQCVYYRDQAKKSGVRYWHEEQGFNYALSNISAAIGVAEFGTISEKLNSKRKIHQRYKQLFDQSDVRLWSSESPEIQPNYWLNVLFIEEFKRNKLIDELGKKQIECRSMWPVLCDFPYLSHYPKTLDGTAKLWYETGICIPSGVNLSEEEQQEICEIIQKVISNTN